MTTDTRADPTGEHWPAPTPAEPVSATVRVPGSKSASNRALVLAALADGPSTITGLLDARDTQLMNAGLRALGNEIDMTGYDDIGNVDVRVTPHLMHGPADIDVGLAGTVMRFLPPVATLARGRIRFDGDEYARERPMAAVIDSLRDLGAGIAAESPGRLPFVVDGVGELRGGEVTVDASKSSQFVSALLLAAARFNAGVTIHHLGEPIPSLPHIAMTVAMLAEHGVAVRSDGAAVWHVDPCAVRATDRAIEPDLSNAAPFLAAALVTGGSVTVPDWPSATTQPGDMVRELLVQMGASVELTAGGLVVSGGSALNGIDADLSAVGELAPTIAALAVLADQPSTIRGIAHLRGHETDRLAAVATEMNKLGGSVTETADGWRITPRRLHGGVFSTYGDHRMATAAALVGLRVPGVLVENVATTAKTIPDFPSMWHALTS